MENRSELIIWLVIWVAICAAVIRDQWSRKIPSVGLPLAYLLSLSMIHFFGGLIYALPWYNAKTAYLLQAGSSYAQVSAGFIESVYGVMGFGLGSTILAYWILRTFKPSWLRQVPQNPDLQLPKQFLQIGLFFFLVFSPTIGRIPGFQGFSASGVYLFVVSLCLACWKAWHQQDKKAFFFWIAVACTIPIITINLLGFIGYGVAATLVILIFISSFYRPRWHILIIGFLVFTLGLSVFVTYLRDRSEIRANVWGNKGIEAKYERMITTFSNFEIIDFSKQSHLEAIDSRLNQNGLVGQAVERINSGQSVYALGETFLQAALAPIPRILWPDKPIFGGSGNIVSYYTGQKFADGTSVGVGQVLEFYFNFGSTGVFLGFMVIGIIIRIIDITAAYKLLYGNWLGFVSWFLPGLSLLQPGGTLAEITASFAASVVLMILIRKLVLRKAARFKQPRFDT
jgi:hypothetical protein